ncbi:MAG: SRPBCC domain-containing protein [Deltaproteobacteria bacterium]|nr:SRPBCC domain-containing protein [Deltaproteobacteria bacterium]
MRSSSLKTTTIRQKAVVPAPPDAVYEAFMNPKLHTRVTGSKATGSNRVGGRFTAWGGYIKAKNLKLEKGRKIVQAWETVEWPKNYPPSTLELTFKPTAGGTEISMVQSKVPSRAAKDCRAGWPDAYWKPLSEYFGSKK